MKLTIGHLYPDLLNLYGDRGNIQCFRKRLEWRGIEAEMCIRDSLSFCFLPTASEYTALMQADHIYPFPPQYLPFSLLQY